MIRKYFFKQMASWRTGHHFYGSSTRCCKVLHTEFIAPEMSIDERKNDYTILFLHGLLGSGRNLKTFAKKLVKQSHGSCRGGWLMDLRGHGKSYQSQKEDDENDNITHREPPTFRDCAQDIYDTMEDIQKKQRIPPTQIIVGHSFGGRLALEYAANIAENNSVKAVWLLDTVPGQANESVDKVLTTITRVLEDRNKNNTDLNKENLTKKDMIKVLTDPPHSLDRTTAQWLAMSYDEKSGDNFGYDTQMVDCIKPEFASQDFMGLLRKILRSNNQFDTTKAEDANNTIHVHVVRGGLNTGWTIPILSELERLKKEYPATFHLHVLPKANHNLHIDDLNGLLKLFS